MSGDLFIGTTGDTLVDAFDTYGICMGEGFLDALNAPVELKEFVSNESRLLHGKSVVIDPEKIRKSSRELALSFVVMGDGTSLEEMQSSLRQRRASFLQLLYSATLDIYVPKDDEDVYYHLLYKGKSSTHSYNLSRTLCTITAKFEEPNPDQRGETVIEDKEGKGDDDLKDDEEQKKD